MSEKPAETTVFYDGSCPLCTAEIGVYRKCAGADSVAFVDVSAAAAGPVVPGLDKLAAMKRFHVRTADGNIASGAEGFARLWLALPRWRWLGRIILLPGVLQLSEVAYRGFLIIRPALQWLWRVKTSTRTRA